MSEQGDHDLYRLTSDGGDVAVFHPSVGAPLAVGLLEEAIAVGWDHRQWTTASARQDLFDLSVDLAVRL